MEKSFTERMGIAQDKNTSIKSKEYTIVIS